MGLSNLVPSNHHYVSDCMFTHFFIILIIVKDILLHAVVTADNLEIVNKPGYLLIMPRSSTEPDETSLTEK